MRYFQDQIPNNHCFGCGPANPGGLQIKSYWGDNGKAGCDFKPEVQHCSGPVEYLNGGILATLIDCHCICTAIAQAYRNEGKEIGEGEVLWYVTGKLEIDYLRPVKIDNWLQLFAEVTETTEKKMIVQADVLSQKELCARGKVVAIKVGVDW